MDIIICDDDSFTLKLTGGMVQKAIENVRSRDVLRGHFRDFSEIEQFLRRNPGTYLYFMDLDLGRGQMNGIETARRIKAAWPSSKVVFVTSHGEKTIDIFRSGVEPFGFIEKNPDERIMVGEYEHYILMAYRQSTPAAAGEQTENACQERNSGPDAFIEIPIGIDEQVKVEIERITYVEALKSVAHNVCFHTLDGSSLEMRDTLQHVQEQLGDRFFRCHRSVLVNKDCAVALEDGQIRLANGEHVPCAYGRKKEFMTEVLKKKK